MAGAAEQSGRALFQSERQRETVALALEQGRVDVAELATTFGVTTETVRRDLSELQGRRLVRRVHGGAIPWETTGFVALIDFSKAGQDHLVRFAHWSAIDVLITDTRADDVTVAKLESLGPTVLRA